MSGEEVLHDDWCPLNGCRCGGKCGPCAEMPECPNPVPSEVAETTAGEREVERSEEAVSHVADTGHKVAYRDEFALWACWDCAWVDSAFVVNGLSAVDRVALRDWLAAMNDFRAGLGDLEELVERIVAAREAAASKRVRREEGERIAQAIEAERERWYATEHPQTAVGGHAYTLAARIARAASVGRGEGS